MKKVIVLHIVFLLCGFYVAQAQNTDTTDVGVVINGVKWATRNVDAPGTFAATPEDVGMLYQWNRKTAWSAIEPKEHFILDDWNNTIPIGDTWEKVNDPCPSGWRVPAMWEIAYFLEVVKVDKELIVLNDMNGYKITDKITGNSIFLPAVGHRSSVAGSLSYAGFAGFYLSSTHSNGDFAYALCAHNGSISIYNSYLTDGLSVRCVAE